MRRPWVYEMTILIENIAFVQHHFDWVSHFFLKHNFTYCNLPHKYSIKVYSLNCLWTIAPFSIFPSFCQTPLIMSRCIHIVNQSNADSRFALGFFRLSFVTMAIVAFQFVFRISYASYHLNCEFVAFIPQTEHSKYCMPINLLTMYCVVNPFTVQIVHS